MDLGKILIVDDEQINLDILNDILVSYDYKVLKAINGEKALEILNNEGDIDLVITDFMMPVMDGNTLTIKIKENPKFQNIPVIMLTSIRKKEQKIKSLEAGVDDFLNKPIDKTEIKLRVKGFLKVKKYNDKLSAEKKELEETLSDKENKLVNALDEMKLIYEDKQNLLKMLEEESMKLLEAYREMKEYNVKFRQQSLEMIQGLSTAAEFRDNETGSHIKRMSNYCAIIAKRFGCSDEQCEELLYTSPMHDVGKLGIPDKILMKPGKLNKKEWNIMQTHSMIGFEILKSFNSDIMNKAAIIAKTHHEKWDGSGYPLGLKGNDIPIEGRIVAISDVFDALISERVYKEAFSIDKALDIMKESKGTHFDPELLDVFFSSLDEILETKEKYKTTEEELEIIKNHFNHNGNHL